MTDWGRPTPIGTMDNDPPVSMLVLVVVLCAALWVAVFAIAWALLPASYV